jgi:IS30 family transposase
LALYSALRWRVAQKLALQWSPQQISGWLKQGDYRNFCV